MAIFPVMPWRTKKPKRKPKPITLKPTATCATCGHNDLTHNLLKLVGETGCAACACPGFTRQDGEA